VELVQVRQLSGHSLIGQALSFNAVVLQNLHWTKRGRLASVSKVILSLLVKAFGTGWATLRIADDGVNNVSFTSSHNQST